MKIGNPHSTSRHGSVVLALFFAGCSQPSTAPTTALSPAKAEKLLNLSSGGTVQDSAAGDVKNGPIEIERVRVTQTGGVPGFYANPGGEYVVRPGRQVQLWVEWSSNPAVSGPPRLDVDWGVGGADSRDNIHCGPCLLSRTYGTEGRYQIKVIIDDRVGGVTTRTFTLNVREETVDSGFGTFNGTFSASDPQFNRRTSSFVPPATGLPCSISGSVPNYYHTYSINHPGGPLTIETTAGTLDTFLHLYSGSFNPGDACQNNVASDDDTGAGLLSLIQATFPAGSYVLVVTTFDSLDTGTYTLVIQ